MSNDLLSSAQNICHKPVKWQFSICVCAFYIHYALRDKMCLRNLPSKNPRDVTEPLKETLQANHASDMLTANKAFSVAALRLCS